MLLVLTVTTEQQWGSPTTVANVRPAAWTPCGPWTEVLLVKLVVKAHGLGEFWLPVTRTEGYGCRQASRWVHHPHDPVSNFCGNPGGQVLESALSTAPTCQGAYLVQQRTWATGRRGHEVCVPVLCPVLCERASFLVELAHRNSSEH